MQVLQEALNLKEVLNLKVKILEAEELSAHHKRELDKDPEDFALKLRYNSFRGFIQQLQTELAAYEKETKVAKDISNQDPPNEHLITLVEQKTNSEQTAMEALEKIKVAQSVLQADLNKLLVPYITVTAKMELLQEQAKKMLAEKELYSDRELSSLRDQLNNFLVQYQLIIDDYIVCIGKYSMELSKNSEVLEENYRTCINAVLGLMADKSNQTSEKLETFINNLNKIASSINSAVQYYTEFSTNVVKPSMAKEERAKDATLNLMSAAQKFALAGNNVAKISQEAITICIRDYVQT